MVGATGADHPDAPAQGGPGRDPSRHRRRLPGARSELKCESRIDNCCCCVARPCRENTTTPRIAALGRKSASGGFSRSRLFHPNLESRWMRLNNLAGRVLPFMPCVINGLPVSAYIALYPHISRAYA